jgi:hypothetical protein
MLLAYDRCKEALRGAKHLAQALDEVQNISNLSQAKSPSVILLSLISLAATNGCIANNTLQEPRRGHAECPISGFTFLNITNTLNSSNPSKLGVVDFEMNSANYLFDSGNRMVNGACKRMHIVSKTMIIEYRLPQIILMALSTAIFCQDHFKWR